MEEVREGWREWRRERKDCGSDVRSGGRKMQGRKRRKGGRM